MNRELQGWVAQAINAERAAKGWTVKGLAQQADINERVLMRALKCERDMHMEQLAAIADALDVRPSYLMAEADRRYDSASPKERRAMIINTDMSLTSSQKSSLLSADDSQETL